MKHPFVFCILALTPLLASCFDVSPDGGIQTVVDPNTGNPGDGDNGGDGGSGGDGGGGGPPQATVLYSLDIQPIFRLVCIHCHGGAGGLGLENLDGLLAGGNSGPVVLPGDGDGSLLIRRLDGRKTPRMPTDAEPLLDAQIDAIKTWIDEGAQDN